MKKSPDGTRLSDVVAEARARRELLEKGYRERALKLFAPICGRCGREFSGKRLRELTVHHKDHNHEYNPPDGSNWELLCLYCHDNEHSRQAVAEAYAPSAPGRERQRDPDLDNKPFAGLDKLLQTKK
jgi:hypothetical protein